MILHTHTHANTDICTQILHTQKILRRLKFCIDKELSTFFLNKVSKYFNIYNMRVSVHIREHTYLHEWTRAYACIRCIYMCCMYVSV